jgi:hypothetical protein
VAALEVSRLEERIRYVVEGQQRAQARWAELMAQNAQWAERQAAAGVELEAIAAQMVAGDDQAGVLAAQAEECGKGGHHGDRLVRSHSMTARMALRSNDSRAWRGPVNDRRQ